ncbi:hypothetical protein KJ966_22700 [bacterium]|nr:hypothetical protein [bacterium]
MLKKTKCYSKGRIEDKTHVEYLLVCLGQDLTIIISGGASHIGSLSHTKKQGDETTYRYTYPTHRDDVIVDKAIRELQQAIEGELLVVGGIHYDDISKEQIEIIVKNSDDLLEEIKNDLKNRVL